MERQELIKWLQAVHELLSDKEDQQVYEAWEIIETLLRNLQNGPVQN